ncbi:hypothetical protein MSG_01291 [Mycobacterium shigaense]|uniref:Uncharacterized protein n=1 Tax=Mycobacterium shigaense TaxID=722731 RepID=A0A1Z4EES9_9MYCO|nr:hypothetical protein MSG_01291 [Mycobacterium shigaense]
MHLTTDEPITAERHPLAIGVIGGATTVVDYGGLRFITDRRSTRPATTVPTERHQAPPSRHGMFPRSTQCYSVMTNSAGSPSATL